MGSSVVSSASIAFALAFVAGCGAPLDGDLADEEWGDEGSGAFTLQAPGRAGPVVHCAAMSEASIATWDFDGYPVDVRITRSDAQVARDRLVWFISLESNDGRCTARRYRVVLPLRLGADAFSAEVYSGVGLHLGGITWNAGALPKLQSRTGATVATSPRGPFVVTNAMSVAMVDPNVLVLLDARVLNALSTPQRLDGVPAANAQAKQAIATAFQAALGAKSLEVDTFRFRIDMGEMDAAAQGRLARAITDYIKFPAVYADHGGRVANLVIGDDHHHIDHTISYGDNIPDVQIGGFFNGHRIYMRGAEQYLESLGGADRVPLRRLPSWDPGTTVPASFLAGISDPNGAVPLGLLKIVPNATPINVCARFAPANPALLADVVKQRDAFRVYFDPWHQDVHNAVGKGADFSTIARAAFAPIFWPWHATIDIMQQSFESCGYVRVTRPAEKAW